MQNNIFDNHHWKKYKKGRLLGYGGVGWDVIKTDQSYNKATVLHQNAVQQYRTILDAMTQKLLFGYTISAQLIGCVRLEIDCFVDNGIVKHLYYDCTHLVKPYPQPIFWSVTLPKDTRQCVFRLVIRKAKECQFFAPKLYFV